SSDLRVILPYERALALCDRRERIDVAAADQPFVDEVLDLIIRLDLRPIAMTGYRREPYVGQDADLGLRVTLDHRVRGRDRDFDLRSETENRYIIRPDLAVMEVKVNERAPYWVTDIAARYGLQIQRISKYCQSVEAHGLAPRSVFHVPEDQQVLPACTADSRPSATVGATTTPTATPTTQQRRTATPTDEFGLQLHRPLRHIQRHGRGALAPARLRVQPRRRLGLPGDPPERQLQPELRADSHHPRHARRTHHAHRGLEHRPSVCPGGCPVGGEIPERDQGDQGRRLHLPRDGHRHGLRHPFLHSRRPRDGFHLRS